ncbi:MAG: nucleotide sugar dehydrogenase [Anaerolineales bacterium]|nr:nucleotide sugar dehydrogenase [Anaerolineales bacterium]
MLASFLEKIEQRTAVVGVVGLGYAGLPLVVGFAQAGLRVIGVDVDAGRVAELQAGRSYVEDVPAATIAELVRAGRLSATTDAAALAETDAIIICVPTPLRKSREPDLSFVVAASDRAVALARPGQLFVLESTTYPGTTDEILAPRLAERGLTVGVDVFLAFSPERVDPGNKRFGLKNTPKVVGGVTEACTQAATALYATAVDQVVPVSSPRAAEMTKLLENTFRAVNIALVNEVALMCTALKLDVWEVIAAASTKPYGFMTFTPGPGIGGHCLPVDPLYLSWKLKALNANARFIDLADEINSQMPAHVVELTAQALDEGGGRLRGSDVLVIGAAYKPNISDVRESPALDVLIELERRGARPAYHDPHVPALRIDDLALHSEPLTAERLANAAAVIVVTAHKDIDYDLIATHARLIIDTRNALAPRSTAARVVKL